MTFVDKIESQTFGADKIILILTAFDRQSRSKVQQLKLITEHAQKSIFKMEQTAGAVQARRSMFSISS